MKNKPQTKVNFIYVLARPFGGKDSLANALIDKYPEAAKISPGELLRDRPLLESVFPRDKAEMIENMSNEGKRVPDDDVRLLVVGRIKQEVAAGKTAIIFAGIPRNERQYKMLRAFKKEQEISEGWDIKDAYVHIGISERKANKRIANRIKEEGRADDKDAEVIHRRHQVFNECNIPLLRRTYLKQIFLQERIFYINGSLPKDEVFRRAEASLRPYLPQKIRTHEGQIRHPRKER